MKIIPTKSNSNCGLLNFLKNKNNSLSPTILIPENKFSDEKKTISTIIDCNIDSDWMSSESDPSIKIQLYNYRIIPLYISVKRRAYANYPKQSTLQGLDVTGWVDICDISLTYENPSQTIVRQCKGSRYFSSFRLLQSLSSHSSLKYMEINNFDLFGNMIYDFASLYFQNSSFRTTLLLTICCLFHKF